MCVQIKTHHAAYCVYVWQHLLNVVYLANLKKRHCGKRNGTLPTFKYTKLLEHIT